MPFDVVSYALAKRALRRALSHASRHAVGGADEIPDNALTRAKIKDLLPITRADLEYPTEDVAFVYLEAIGKAEALLASSSHGKVVTSDSFTDKAVRSVCGGHRSTAIARLQDIDNLYRQHLSAGRATEDNLIVKVSGGTESVLASEAVDISGDFHFIMFSASGSTLKAFRDDLTAERISATDTEFASGRFGYGVWDIDLDTTGRIHYNPVLLAPASPLRRPLVTIEAEVVGSGTFEDPYRPDLAQQLDSHPVYGDIDKLAVTWGAFDHKKEHAVMLIMITGDNPYQAGAIDKQKEHASKKGLKVLNPPKDYAEAVEQHRKLKADYPNWLAGKDNYAYQALGHEALELFQVADFYYGELLEHKTHYQQLKRVPDWEMDRTLNRWRDRLQRVDVLHEERDKHVKKLTEVLKKGW